MDAIDTLMVTARAAPRLDPTTANAIASGAINEDGALDPGKAVQDAQATEAFGEVLKAKARLEASDPSIQSMMWDQFDDSRRQLLQRVGYTPPAPKPPGLLSKILHAGNIGEKITAGFGWLAHEAGAPMRNVQHAFRAAQYAADAEAGNGGGISGVISKAAQSGLGVLVPGLAPVNWASAWSATEKGEQTFLPSKLNEVAQKYDPQTFELAKQVAGVTSGREEKAKIEMIAAAPEAQKTALREKLNSPEVAQAVSELQAAKISPGRALARTFGLNPEKGPGILLSGIADGTVDWFTDPLLQVTKAAKVDYLRKVSVESGADVLRAYDKFAGVRATFDDAAKYLQENAAVKTANAAAASEKAATDARRALGYLGTYPEDTTNALVAQAATAGGEAGLGQPVESPVIGRLLNAHPWTAPIVQKLVQEGVTTGEGIRDFLADNANLAHWVAGGGSSPAHPGVTLPYLGIVRRMFGGIKTAAEDVTNESDIVRRLTELVPRATEVDVTSPEFFTFLRRVARFSLSNERTDELLTLAANAPAENVGLLRNIWKTAMGEMFDAAGADPVKTPELWAYRNQFLADVEAKASAEMYAPEGIDLLGDHAAAIWDNQLDTKFAVPDFAKIAQFTQDLGAARKVLGTINGSWIDRAMRVWRQSTLARFGFAFRAGGEELVGASLREGPLDLLKARIAASVAKDEARAALAKKASEALDSGDEAGFWATIMNDRIGRGLKGLRGKLADEEYLNYSRELAAMRPEAWQEEISASHKQLAGYAWEQKSAAQAFKDGTEGRPFYLRDAPEKGYTNWSTADPIGVQKWQAALDQMVSSRIGPTVVESMTLPREEAVQKVADAIEGLGARWKLFERSRVLRGRLAVGVDATAREAAEDHANVALDAANALLRGGHGDGELLADIRNHLLENRKAPDVPTLSEIPIESRPVQVQGPQMVPVAGPSKWEMGVNKFFQTVVGRPMDAMIREPLFHHNYAMARRDLQGITGPLVDSGVMKPEAAQEVALQKALHDTIPYIHDPKLRSQFSVMTRNLAPFWFAQEQFYKRWAMALTHSPELFREAQLTMMGLRHAGILQTDDQGNDYFMYPAVGFVQKVLAKAAQAVGLGDAVLPIEAGFSGAVKFASPGLERLGLPSFGPLVSIPLTFVTNTFPELQPLQEQLLGQRGAGRSYWEQVVPTTVARVLHVAFDDPSKSPQFASAMMQAIKYLDATGNGLPDDPVGREKWLDRVRNWTRILFITRTIYGFATPASPEMQFDPNNLDAQLRDLLRSMPIEQALAAFIKEHPDATPYTVFQSKTGGGPLPATEQAMKFITDNADFLSRYPAAASWFIPASPKGSKFSLPAYREQLALALHQRKAPEEFYNDVKYADAARDYFDARDKRDQALQAAANDPYRKDQVRQVWADWSKRFLDSHPIFADQLMSAEGARKRTESLRQLRSALLDPGAPINDQSKAVATMLSVYDTYKAQLATLSAQRGVAQSQRRRVTEQFNAWAKDFVNQNPDARPFYERIIRPDTETSAERAARLVA